MWIKNPNPDSARVQFPPPVAVLLTILLGWLLHWLAPIPVFAEPFKWYLGGALAVFGGLLVLTCVGLFKRSQTAIPPWEPTSHLVTSGPYRFTRNPIYLGMIVFATGAAVMINGLLCLATVSLLWVFLNFYVIPHEERYLASKIGAPYDEFRTRVRRWF